MTKGRYVTSWVENAIPKNSKFLFLQLGLCINYPLALIKIRANNNSSTKASFVIVTNLVQVRMYSGLDE